MAEEKIKTLNAANMGIANSWAEVVTMGFGFFTRL